MINNVILVGRLVSDPELKTLNEGNTVLNFSLAINRQYSKQETVDYIDCVVWNRQAELMAQYLGQGSLIGVVGRLEKDHFEVDGIPRTKVKVLCENVQFLESKARADERVLAQVEKAAKSSETDDELPW